MCHYFAEEARLLDWYEKHRDLDGRLFDGQTADLVQGLIVTEVFDLLIETDRPMDAARLVIDGSVRGQEFVRSFDVRRHAMAGPYSGSAEIKERSDSFSRQKLRTDMSRLHAAMLLAGRVDEAAEVANLLLQALDDADSRLALVRAGIDIVGRQEVSFSKWLAEAEAAGANVRVLKKRLEKLPVPVENASTPAKNEK
jgi:hypothetical protein